MQAWAGRVSLDGAGFDPLTRGLLSLRACPRGDELLGKVYFTKEESLLWIQHHTSMSSRMKGALFSLAGT